MDTVNNEQIYRQIYVFMYIHQIFQHMYQVDRHRDWFIPSGIYFQIWDTLAPDVLIQINVL